MRATTLVFYGAFFLVSTAYGCGSDSTSSNGVLPAASGSSASPRGATPGTAGAGAGAGIGGTSAMQGGGATAPSAAAQGGENTGGAGQGGAGQGGAGQGGANTGGLAGTSLGPGNGFVKPPAATSEAIAAVGSPYDVSKERSGPDSWRSVYGEVPKIIGVPLADGSFDVAWLDTQTDDIVLTHVVPVNNETYETDWHLKLHSLGQLGGFTRDDAGNIFYMTTVSEDTQHDVEPSGVHREGIAQLLKLSPSGEELFRTQLKTEIDGKEATPIYDPMSAGTGRLVVGDGRVMVTLSQHGEYDPQVSSRHQWQIYLDADADTGNLTKMSRGPSHSFDQRLIFDGTDFIGAALGDASLRGVGLSKLGKSPHRVVFAIKGGDKDTAGGYNNTFTRLGNVRASKEGYVTLFSTENSAESTGDSRVVTSRNLVPAHAPKTFDQIEVPKNQYDVAILDTQQGNQDAASLDIQILDYWGKGFEGKNKGLAWLTSYTDREQENVERPKLVPIADDKFILLWEKWTLNEYVSSFAMLVDEWGNVLTPAKDIGSARLQRGDDAFTLAGRAAWLTGEEESSKLVLQIVNSELELERIEL